MAKQSSDNVAAEVTTATNWVSHLALMAPKWFKHAILSNPPQSPNKYELDLMLMQPVICETGWLQVTWPELFCQVCLRRSAKKAVSNINAWIKTNFGQLKGQCVRILEQNIQKLTTFSTECEATTVLMLNMSVYCVAKIQYLLKLIC